MSYMTREEQLLGAMHAVVNDVMVQVAAKKLDMHDVESVSLHPRRTNEGMVVDGKLTMKVRFFGIRKLEDHNNSECGAIASGAKRMQDAYDDRSAAQVCKQVIDDSKML